MKSEISAEARNAKLSAEEYQLLVDELIKDEPDQKLVRRLMLKQGISYTQDPISQMSRILKSMSLKSFNRSGLKLKDSNAL